MHESVVYEFRSRTRLDDRYNFTINEIASLVERLEDTIVGGVAITCLKPLTYTVVELSRKEIVSSINDVTKEVVIPEFSRNVWLKPRTWFVTSTQGGYVIKKR